MIDVTWRVWEDKLVNRNKTEQEVRGTLIFPVWAWGPVLPPRNKKR